MYDVKKKLFDVCSQMQTLSCVHLHLPFGVCSSDASKQHNLCITRLQNYSHLQNV